MEIDTRPHNKADIKFHAHKMLDGFQKFSNKMGEVWSSTAFIPHTKVHNKIDNINPSSPPPPPKKKKKKKTHDKIFVCKFSKYVKSKLYDIENSKTRRQAV